MMFMWLHSYSYICAVRHILLVEKMFHSVARAVRYDIYCIFFRWWRTYGTPIMWEYYLFYQYLFPNGN
jgi:hypothetical protein